MTVDVVIADARWETLDLRQIANQAFFETLFLLNLNHKSFACCVLACDNKQIKRLNGKNCPTNVLSFPESSENYEVKSTLTPTEAHNPRELGNIAIAFEICKKEATISKVKLEHHLYHLITHSVLHLLGFDHEEEENAAKMEKIEVQVLAKLGISNPYL